MRNIFGEFYEFPGFSLPHSFPGGEREGGGIFENYSYCGKKGDI